MPTECTSSVSNWKEHWLQSESAKSTNKQAGLTKHTLRDYQFAGKLPFWYTLTMETDTCTLRKEHQSHKNV